MIESDYLGIKIIFDEYRDMWTVPDQNEWGDFKHEKRSECVAWIDKQFNKLKKKVKEKFERCTVLYDYSDFYEIATVTSKCETKDYEGRNEYWITFRDVRKKTANIKEYDEEIFGELKNLYLKRDELRKIIKDMESKLKPFLR